MGLQIREGSAFVKIFVTIISGVGLRGRLTHSQMEACQVS